MKSDYQRVVEYLRDLRQGPLQTVTDEIAQAAADYAALCAEANDRLRKCSGFLQQDLRSEAIHLADESPNLLDLVAALDLPDAQTWSEFCQNNGLAVPPPLQMDRAAQLNDAYALDQPLEHLLSRHRFLALSRSPVRERLATLRQIAQIDVGSATWEKDIRMFEKVRLRELPTSFYNAVKNRDEAGITELMTELTQSPWFETVPADLTTAVADAYGRMQRATCEAELQKLVEPLRDAFAARSLQECQALVRRWKKVMTTYSVTKVSSQLEDEIKPVVAFVNESEKREEFLKKFRDSCKAFGKMLDGDLPDVQLEAGYAKLGEFKEPIPEELTQRYAAIREGRQKQVNRSHKLRLVGIGVTAAAIVAVVLTAGWVFMRGNTAASWAQRIRDANAQHSLDGLKKAQDTVADLRKNHPEFLSDQRVAAAVLDTDKLEASRQSDEAELTEHLHLIDAASKTAAAMADKAAGTGGASVDDLLRAADEARSAVDQTPKDGRLNWVDPRQELPSALIKLGDLSTRLKGSASALVRKEVDADTLREQELTSKPQPVSKVFAGLSEIDSRLSALKSSAGLDKDTVDAIDQLAGTIQTKRAQLAGANEVAGAMDQIRDHAATPDDLKKALADFNQKFPNDPRKGDFEQAIARLPMATALEAWRQAIAPWGGKFQPTMLDASKRVDTINGYLTVYPDSPMAGPATTYREYLKHAADALAEKGSWQDAFADLIAQPLLSELSYVEDSDHNRYYVGKDMDLKHSKLNGQVSLSFKEVQGHKRVVINAPTTLLNETPQLAPQAVLVSGLSETLKRIDENDWDTWGIDFVEKLRGREDIDIVVRAILIHKALQAQDTLTGWALGDLYAKTLAQLGREKPEEMSVVDATAVPAAARKSLTAILSEIPSAADAKKKLEAKKNALYRQLAFDVAGTGVALKDDAGQWTVSAKGGMLEGNVLWTVAPGAAGAAAGGAGGDAAAPAAGGGDAAPAGNPGSLVKIGVIAGGKPSLDENALSNVPQGSIVYVTKP